MKRFVLESSRRSNVKRILLARGATTLAGLKDEFRKEKLTLPAVKRDVQLHEWLMKIDGVRHRANNGVVEYVHVNANPTLTASTAKRKNTSPIDHQQTSKRQLCLSPIVKPPGKKPQETSNKSLLASKIPTPRSSTQSKQTTPKLNRAISLSPRLEERQQQTRPTLPTTVNRQQTPPQMEFESSKITSTAIKDRPRAANDFPRKQEVPKIYGVVMIGDDNFLNIAAFDLNYEISYQQKPRRRLRRCGNCISGLRIRQATELIKRLDDSVEHVIINVGSVDIAEGRDLIEMMTDLKELLYTCEQLSVCPILTTLPPLPNYLLGIKKDILVGFNNILRHNISTEYPVIDLNLCLLTHGKNTDLDAYQAEPRHVSGSTKPFVLWNRQGRKRIYNMILKNLGHALYFTNFLGEHF